ncbi:MAG: hypothetical protein ABSA33_01140, partial [Candidatus Micrarchaeaceae archaeon]
MKNIYESRHYKYYILIPVALLLISLYFIPKIQLDSSLKGGVSIQLITNSTVNPRTLTSLVDSKISGAQASVSSSPGGLSITIAANSSIAGAETDLLSFYNSYSNYSTYTYNITAMQTALASQPSNATLQKFITSNQTGLQKSAAAMNASLAAELKELKPFIGTVSYNTSNIENLPNVAKNSYTNASGVYQNEVLAKIKGVIPFSSYSYNDVTPTLGQYFLNQMETI